MSELYILKNKNDENQILVGKKVSNSVIVKWPAALGLPMEQMLVEPQNGLVGITEVNASRGEYIASDYLNVPVYSQEQIRRAQEEGKLGDFTPVSLGTFIKQAQEQIKERHYYLSAPPRKLDEETLESVELIRVSGLETKQKVDKLNALLDNAMGRKPNDVELQRAVEGYASEIRFTRDHAEQRAVFMRQGMEQPLSALGHACLRHLMLNNTEGAFKNVRITLSQRLAHEDDPAAAAITVAGYMRHYINTEQERSRVDGLIAHMSKDLHLEGNNAFLQSVASTVNQGVPVFKKQRNVVNDVHEFLNDARKTYSDLNMLTSAMVLMSKIDKDDDAAWLAHRAEHIKSAPEQQGVSLSNRRP